MNQDWQTTRNQFMRQVGGDMPGAQLEDTLINAYAEHPAVVEKAMEKIALAHKAGKIRSPWGALKAEVVKAADAARNPTHERGTTKAKAVQRAEQWIRNAGLHYDRESEIELELYGQGGLLHEYPETKATVLELWQDLAPLGEQTEQEAIERGLRYQQQQERLGRPPNRDPETITL